MMPVLQGFPEGGQIKTQNAHGRLEVGPQLWFEIVNGGMRVVPSADNQQIRATCFEEIFSLTTASRPYGRFNTAGRPETQTIINTQPHV